MTNYEQIKEILQTFADNHHIGSSQIETMLSEVSDDKSETKRTGIKTFVYNACRKDIAIIDMDEVAHNIYRHVRFPESTKESESLASVDAFVISSDDVWYFIEFKNQKISKTKDSVTKKAYQNWYWLVDVLYEMNEQHQMKYDKFNYDNPIEFARNNVVYILVVSEDKNLADVDKMRKCFLAGKRFQTEFIKKLEKYIFKETYIYTPDLLEKRLIKLFKY